ncbi:MAG: enoyl-CoA hydratase/isomerase family protein [Deltaproteobacteria bacterium]|nr:MAG: enoyl-CoA hydratase/isomerase family protein [Deltaproteobacteria bacterium]
MNGASDFEANYEFFSGQKIDDIVVLSLGENLLHHATDLAVKGVLFDYLDLVSRSDVIKVLLIIGSPKKVGREEYIRFYRQLLEPAFDIRALARLYNAANQFILKMVDFGKPIVHADSGKVISLYMNIGLACDYRIIGDNVVFQNPYLDLGLVPKGGGAFFLSRLLGSSTATEILLSDKDITAKEALSLGIVDKTVPSDELDETALKIAQDFARKPMHSLAGIKRLLSCCLRELQYCLECENELLLQIVSRPEFQEKLLEYT